MRKVLIIDDDPQMYRLYRTIFSIEGFEAVVAANGKDGLDQAQSFQPDVILLDLMMKDLNGLAVLSSLKADAAVREIPVVVLSNVSDPVITNQAKAEGAAQFIVKSNTEPSDMVALVRALLAKTAGTPAPESDL